MRHLLEVVSTCLPWYPDKRLLENAFSVVTESCHILCLKRKTILGSYKCLYLIFGMTIISLCEDINVFKLLYHLRTSK
jgi:hypothetical protein